MNTEIKHHYLSSHALSCNLSKDQLNELCSSANFRVADKGENIYFESESDNRIFLVLKGVIKISEMNENGNEMIKEIIREGDFFGDISFNHNENDVEYAIALTDDTVICSFNRSEFEAILNRNAMLALNFAKKVGGKLRKLETRHSNLVFNDVKTRLINFFKEWATSEGKCAGNKIVLANYLTHNDIAGLISTSRQSVTILLNELKGTGLFSYNRKEIEISQNAFSIN
ncbi:MAG: Crp/Fnr family transcriptional regulator [Bacteroidia bacterium]